VCRVELVVRIGVNTKGRIKMIKQTRNFRMIYSPETQAAMDKWSKALSDYDRYFIERNSEINPRIVKDALLKDEYRKSINEVLLNIHKTAIPVAINYG
tara:strand:+ start:65 stop:358 length:294 start_codon:yes stop_codon:yes gene_type:complete